MGSLRTEKTIVRIKIEYGRAELGHRLHSWGADQVVHGIEGRHDALVEEQNEAYLDLGLGGAGGHMQKAHVVAIGAFCGARVQRVVGTAECQAREQIFAIAVVGECTGLRTRDQMTWRYLARSGCYSPGLPQLVSCRCQA